MAIVRIILPIFVIAKEFLFIERNLYTLNISPYIPNAFLTYNIGGPSSISIKSAIKTATGENISNPTRERA